MIAAAVVRNAVALNLAAVSASNAVIHAAVIMAMETDMDMVMVMVTDLDLVDAGGFGLFLSYSSAVADGALAEDLEDTVIQVSSSNV